MSQAPPPYESSSSHDGICDDKPNPLIAVKYESLISSNLFFLTLNSALFLVVGALATRYHTTLYIGALAAIASILLGSTLLLLHKVMDSSVKKSTNKDGDVEGGGANVQGDGSSIIKGGLNENGGTGWRDTMHQNLWDGVYPPNQKMGSILGQVLITILWMISTAITIEYHVLVGKGEKPKVAVRQGPLWSLGELSFSALCFMFSFFLLITMIIQRRQTSKEMVKALCSQARQSHFLPPPTP